MIGASIRAFVLIAALATMGRAQVTEGRDVLLSVPYGLKATLPLLLLPGALDHPESLPFHAVTLGAITLPNAMTLRKVFTADAEGARQWRNVVFWCDLGLAVTAAGLGSYLLATAEEGNDHARAGAFVLGFYSAPLLGLALLDRLPFRMEAAKPFVPELSLGLAPGGPGQGRGPTMLVATDWLLSSPYLLKAVFPLFLIPEAIMDGDAAPITAVLLSGLTFPNAMLLKNLYTGNAEGVRKWRRIVFWCDLGMAAATAGYGAYLIASSSRDSDIGSGWDALAGVAIISFFSVPLAAFSLIDRIPFDLEKNPARISLGLGVPARDNAPISPALTLRLLIPI